MSNTIWTDQAIQRIEADFARTADTPLIKLPFAGTPNIQLYLKDETAHSTGSFRHRLAHTLFIYSLHSGWITQDTPIIEASFSSTTIAEAYFAQLLGLRFIAVVPQDLAPASIAHIERYGGECYRVRDAADIYTSAHKVAAQVGGHFMDRLTYGVQAAAWYSTNNLASSIFEQLRNEPYPQPTWLMCNVCVASTPAMLSHHQALTDGRTGVCVVEPDPPIIYDYTHQTLTCEPLNRSAYANTSRLERTRSFLPNTVDRMVKVADEASIATLHVLRRLFQQRYGIVAGYTLYGAFQLMAEMERDGEAGSIVAILETGSEPDQAIYYDHAWLEWNGYQIEPYLAQLHHFQETGEWTVAVNA